MAKEAAGLQEQVLPRPDHVEGGGSREANNPHFLVYTYNKSGPLHPHSSFKKRHCFYQGYAAEIPNSVVTLSTCSGLRGLLQLVNVSYGIEPLESTAMFEHMLYQIKNNKADFLPLQDNYTMIQLGDQAYRILVKSEKKPDIALLTRTLKIQIIMEKALYDYMGSEVAIATEKIVHIFGLINTMFSQLKLTVMLTSLEIWSDQNKILCTGHVSELLQRFVSWKENSLFQRSHDMAFLLIYRDYPNYVGATYHGRACDPKLAAGIALYPKRISLEAFSVVMAQLLGVNLGLRYDDIYNCYCPGAACIMNPQAIHSRGVKLFSSCSVDEFKRVVSQPEFECLQNQTISKVVVQGRASECGNGIVEKGEQCDCGPPEECDFKKCCNAETCTFIPSAECGNGPCCDNKTCLLFPRGHICRRSIDPCDFTEFCTGRSEYCVPDMKAIDLEPCNNKTAFCYKGVCRDPARQCAELFGKFAKGGTYLCAEEVNFLHDDFGNCGKTRCAFYNTLCAKIVCDWTNTHITETRNFDVQYTYLGGHICMSAATRKDSKVTDPDNTYVTDGTICDDNKFCLAGSCSFVASYKNLASCNASKRCNGHGVCNNNFNCHCDSGYSPPNCEKTLSSPGGSIDDGYWNFDNGKIVNWPIKKRHAAPKIKVLLISFFVFLLSLILIAIIVLKWNKMKFWKREEALSEGSMSENSSSNSYMTYTELKVK
ncbi:PREDICTED: disintegrin and metalloproteinase domain-containing protein 18 [Myotis brandtii]|uniref:disintegrin and metalloproteinase domain-containing protein 18 n=1 Tax=Myotis brandtii TaxID=109478 RepID=UPI000703F17F|nr:PREDICTED: disintegrin and metalloproteinase domain-containing protein 18 [Myotis brandtii]